MSGLSILTCWLFAGIPGLIFGILAANKASQNPAEARRLTRIGWIVYGIVSLLSIGFLVLFIVLARFSEPTYSYDT